ncbi:sulfur carrier protein ThiS [Cytobacillus spongiae]|jgi:sulfur carrier protein|uniref:sulfur carrier protein ThiS n=1 Tax=Cytobacillus spongiae TaxID=2901381 RepID=UPI001F323173|nr:sulfur carrier protein ThiS [Cytobacillus spongiae]UII56425.1 sulfur carrier protein ThiS [Cytobacillus spongiae]
MNVIVNGKTHELSTELHSVEQLLTFFNLNPKVVIVERNGEIVLKKHYSQTLLADGDQFEFVHFVGGG